MNQLQVLMPMGGLGSRFAKAGYTIPKPLIPVDGKPMFMRALDSFKSSEEIRYIFVIRKEHDRSYNFSNEIRKQIPTAKILILDHDTHGAVETCLIAKDAIDDSLPIVVTDCDIYFESETYFNKIAALGSSNNLDAMLLTFSSNDSRYSYVELDHQDTVLRTAEKNVISDCAILGGYFFRSGSLFKQLAESFVTQPLPNDMKEYFLSHLFNILLERGGSVEIAPVDTMHIFGTPEELNAYFATHPQ